MSAEQQKREFLWPDVPSSSEVITYCPFGVNRTCDTGGLSSSINVLRHWPVEVSQMRHSPSCEPKKHRTSGMAPVTYTWLDWASARVVARGQPFTRHNQRPVPIEVDRGNWVRMGRQNLQASPCLHVPQP
eukprot:scaffold50726_cov34-Tisochrysis_lutea.AAC.2